MTTEDPEMPVYMDRHAAEGATPEALAAAHQEDLKIQARYGCKCFTYWFDEDRQSIFCLVEAPNRQAVQDMHRAAHGMTANQIIEVERSSVTAFLGRLTDPEEAQGKPISEPAFRAIMFSDIANSTDIMNKLGDDAAFELQSAHHAIIRKALRKYDGREVDHAGDGFLCSFATVSKSVECAISIQKSLESFNNSSPPASIRVRIGLGAGEPVADGDTLFGSTVNLTARICARSEPEQILAAPVVKDLCAGRRFNFREHGRVELKGFAEPVNLHEVAWR
jgi:class 3 adenylate cyclase